MTFDDLIDHFGSVDKAAKALGLSRQGVYRWQGRDIPLPQQIAYEVATKGRLKADLPRSVRANAA
jgi:hypothetical protein